MIGERGYAGSILRIDLSSRAVTQTATKDYAEKYLGGRGFAARIYWEEVPPSASAFSSENLLIFAVGPLAGFPFVGGSRWQVCGKFPVTPEHFCYSNLGGSWGAGLKSAGYDALVIRGKSESPVYVLIDDGVVTIRDGSALWGRTSLDAQQMLKRELGDSMKVVACGQAGENIVPFATILADGDATGSSGLGAVMGSKRLKAIAVRGRGQVVAANAERFSEISKRFRELKKGKETREAPSALRAMMTACPPITKREVCYGCVGGCFRWLYEAKDGSKGKFYCSGPTFYGRRSQLYYGEWNDVPFFAVRLCDGYGLDQDATLSLVLWLSRCYKAGVLTDENTGIPLSRMGSIEFIDVLVKKISLREGFGEILARGVDRAAEEVGKGTKAFITDYTSKDGRTGEYCPRMYPAHGLLYALEPRQPIQQLHEMGRPVFRWAEWQKGEEGAHISTDVLRGIAKKFWGGELAVDFSTDEGKALAAVKIQDRQYAKESLILCDFMWPVTDVRNSQDHVGDPSLESQLLSAVTGSDIEENELYRIGERIFNLQRAIIVREGHRGRRDDTIPEVFHTTPLRSATMNSDCLAPGKDGQVISRRGRVVDRQAFEKMKEEFYQLRGWDVATGLQTRAKLVRLGLGDVAQDLAEKGLAV